MGGGLVKGQKIASKWQKNLSVSLCISGTIHHMMVIFGTHVQNDDISGKFFSFFKILVFGFFRGKGEKGKKWPKITNFSMFYSISQEL